MATVTKPPALDETLQAVNDTLGEIRDALEGGGGGEYIPKVAGATAGNVPILKADGTLEDSGETIPSKTSDLINDSNFVSDPNYVHTDNNYTDEEKMNVGQITGIKNDLSQLTKGFNKTVLQGGFNQLFDMGICFGRSSEFYNFAFDNSSKKINFSLKDSSITWARIPLCLKAPNSKIYVKLISNENIQPDLWYTETDNSDVTVITPLETKSTSFIFNNATNKPVLSCHFASQWASHSTISMGFIVVNLTKWFGAGNEPSIEEVESILTENYYEYNDYVPSLNGLDVEALDIKMLGWSVPKECPIHNCMDSNRKFHQRVGRVNLGSLSWSAYSGVWFLSSIVPSLNSNGKIYAYIQSSSTDIDGYISATSNGAIVIRGEAFSGNADAFKSAMQGVYLYYELTNEIVTNVDGNEATDNDMISDAWDSTKTYSVGDYCIYNNQLWKCLVQNSGQTPTEGTYWHQTSVGDEFKKIKVDFIPESDVTVHTNDTYIINGILYIALRLQTSSFSSRKTMGTFSYSFGKVLRFNAFGSSRFDDYLDRWCNGFILADSTLKVDPYGGSMAEVDISIALVL